MTIATMSAALYANTNLDSTENEGIRGKMISEFTESIESNYAETVSVIYGGKREDEVDMDDPFFSAMRVPGTPAYEEAMKTNQQEEG